MRFPLLTIAATLASLGAGHARAQDAWVVTALHKLDSRITRQLKVLAEENHAEVRFVSRFRRPPHGNVKLTIELREQKNLNSFLGTLGQEVANLTPKPTPELAREGYLLEVSYSGSAVPTRVQIAAASAAGFHYALLRVPYLLSISPSDLIADLIPAAKSVRVEQAGERVVIADFPSFPKRGIVEGFYGTPWTLEDRLDILRFQGHYGMNVYYYAPKDDPYHRKLWRKPYPRAQISHLREVANTAHSNFIDFCFAVSPGLSMAYSSAADFRKLTAKLSSVSRLGVSCFALFLDDVPPALENPQDRARYETLAEAHINLINRLDRYLRSRSRANRLTVTPTAYTSAWGSRDYIRELGRGVASDVDIVWTGPEVVSPAITAVEARDWGELIRRKPLVWDNFPVNDGIPWRLNLGPLVGRDPDLAAVTSGLIANPMNQAGASMIPLQTVADYLWNPLAYNPERSRAKAITDQYGKDAVERLAPFVKTYGDYWWQENMFEPLFVERREPIDIAEMEKGIRELGSSLDALTSQGRFKKIAGELAPFPEKTRARLAEVSADPAFRRLPDQRLLWRDDYDTLSAPHLRELPKLDGDFAKWRSGPSYTLDQDSQIVRGLKFWKGPAQSSTRVALGWDANFLYIGVDATDPELYQPFIGREIMKGDSFWVTLETAFRKNFTKTRADSDEYRLFFSPGNFSNTPSSIFSDEDYLPPRSHPHNHNKEIKTAWLKTNQGFSGDIAIPAAYFDGGVFSSGYEIGLSFAAQKALPTGKPEEDPNHIVFSSKADRLFPVRLDNPSSYQRLVLIDP
jgi:hypothetical protein